MGTDELAGRRRSNAVSLVASLTRSADEDRRLAAEDRRQAARYLFDAYRDDITGALNRRPGREQLEVLFDRARRDKSVLTVLFVDVDGLKRVNDSQGHDVGDALLAAVGTALRSNLRSYDLVVRYGGDEFVCALPEGTAQVATDSVARIQSSLDRLIPGATISAGWAELRPEDTIADVIRRADNDLYRRRRLGESSSGMRLSQVAPKAHSERRPSVACGVCGGRVGLAEFVLQVTARMTRSADCPDCGALTVIELSQDLTPQPLHAVAPASPVFSVGSAGQGGAYE